MADHIALATIDQYRAGTLEPDRLLEVDDHLAGCQDCRARALGQIDGAAATATLLRTVTRGGADGHCTYEVVEAYVDGRLPAGEAQEVSAHFDACATCAEDLGDLRYARALLNTEATASLDRNAGPIGALTGFWKRRWLPVAGGALAGALGLWLVIATRAPGAAPPSADAPRAAAPATPPTSAAGSAVIASIRDGRDQVVLLASGELSGLPPLAPAVRDAIGSALSTRRLSVVATTLIPRAGTLRGSEAERGFDVIAPVGLVVESDRPTFRWSPHPNATAYRVAVFDTSFVEVASSGELSSPEWVPVSPLPRGTTLIWQVTASTPDGSVQAPTPPAAEARFAVLDRQQADEIARVRRTNPDSHLVLAVLYARAGMREDAEREAKTLAERNPESTVARDLVASLQTPR